LPKRYENKFEFSVAWKVAVGISPESLERGKLLQQQHIASGQTNVAKKRPCPIPIEVANKMDRPGPKMRRMEEPVIKLESDLDGMDVQSEDKPPKMDDKIYVQLSNVSDRDELKVPFECSINLFLSTE
jgi:hypothetical protein